MRCRLQARAAELEAQLAENEQAIAHVERLELKCGMHEAEAEKLRQAVGDIPDAELPSAAELQAMCDKVRRPPPPHFSAACA